MLHSGLPLLPGSRHKGCSVVFEHGGGFLEEKRWTFHVLGMTCATCARIVESSLKKVPGVQFAAVNLATETAFVVASSEVTWESLREAVRKAGYDLAKELPEDVETARYKRAQRNLLVAAILTIPLSILMILDMSGHPIPFFSWIEFVTSSLVLFGCGRGTLKGAWIATTHGHTNMDTLIALGSFASWLTSVIALAGVPIASFGSIAAMIVTLHLTGRFIESFLRDRATRAIKQLLALRPTQARLVVDSRELFVPLEVVKVGDLLRVFPGERFAADGTVEKGASSVDESMVTGEPIPVLKQPGNEVTGGSLNLSGTVDVRVSRVGEDSFLSQMVRMVQGAQGMKVPIQALADRLTQGFVPTILGLAVLSFFIWFFFTGPVLELSSTLASHIPFRPPLSDPLSLSVFAFVATLVIACPCALGLAIPMALATAAGQASHHGVIIRNAESIQTAHQIDTIILDKTGTLTQGQPKVVARVGTPEDIEAAIELESRSNHPFARAISADVPSPKGETPLSLVETPGEGVEGCIKGRTYFVGRPLNDSRYASLTENGQSVVEIRRDGEPVGYFLLEDPLREDAAEAVSTLKRLGILPVMATGDQEKTAMLVAKRTGIEVVHARVTPQEKLDLVRGYQIKGHHVMMVGDGMNDAAALKGADIGVAVGSGSDLAIENADWVIVRGGLSRIIEGILLSQKTFSIIVQNLCWAFGYNVIAIPLAMLALLHPAIAEIAMGLSSITVILNSLRILRERNTALTISN